MQDIRARAGVVIKRMVTWVAQRIVVLDSTFSGQHEFTPILLHMYADVCAVLERVGGEALYTRMYELLHGICGRRNGVPIGTNAFRIMFEERAGAFLEKRMGGSSYEKRDKVRDALESAFVEELKEVKKRDHEMTLADRRAIFEAIHAKRSTAFDNWTYVAGLVSRGLVSRGIKDRRHPKQILHDISCSIVAMAALEVSSNYLVMKERMLDTWNTLHEPANADHVKRIHKAVWSLMDVLFRGNQLFQRSGAGYALRAGPAAAAAQTTSDQMKLAALAAFRSSIFNYNDISTSQRDKVTREADTLMLLCVDLSFMDSIVPRKNVDEHFASSLEETSREMRAAVEREERALRAGPIAAGGKRPFVTLESVGAILAKIMATNRVARAFVAGRLAFRAPTRAPALLAPDPAEFVTQSLAVTDTMSMLTSAVHAFIQSRIMQARETESTFYERIFKITQECIKIENNTIDHIVHRVPGHFT